ncbi:hypothetical protein [Methylobacterium nigriterrae]|uniref:hypothetical protein n=1 Tax=Methylobacterium nigriterrae TaxID=3127512 RepID=UPI003013D349
MTLAISLAAVFTLGCVLIHAYSDKYPNEVREAIVAFFIILFIFLVVGFVALASPYQHEDPARPSAAASMDG